MIMTVLIDRQRTTGPGAEQLLVILVPADIGRSAAAAYMTIQAHHLIRRRHNHVQVM